ncbi:MAG: hypothetical protein ABIR96_10320 [Bdellovibrionota bacterium]
MKPTFKILNVLALSFVFQATAQAALAPQYQRLADLQFVLGHQAISADGTRTVSGIEVGQKHLYQVSFSSPEKCKTVYELVMGEKAAQDHILGSSPLVDLNVVKTSCDKEPIREAIVCSAKGSNPEKDRNYVYYRVTFTKMRGGDNNAAVRALVVGTLKNNKIVVEEVLSQYDFSGFSEASEFSLKVSDDKLPNHVSELRCIRPLGGGMSISN